MSRSETPLRHLVAPIVRRHPGRLGIVALASVVSGFVEATLLVIVVQAAVAMSGSKEGVTVPIGPIGAGAVAIGTLLGIAAALVVARFALQLLVAWEAARLGSAVMIETRSALVRTFLAASWDFQAREQQGHFLELFATMAKAFSAAADSLATASANVIIVLALLGSALLVNPQAAGLVVAAALALALVLRPVRNAQRRRQATLSDQGLDLAAKVTEMTAEAQEIHTFNVGSAVRNRIDTAIVGHGHSMFVARVLQQLTPAIYQALTLTLVVTALTTIYFAGLTELGSLGAVVLIMLRSLAYAQTAQSSYHSVAENAPYIETVLSQQRSYEIASTPRGGTALNSIEDVTFENVSFEYEPGSPVLKDLSFRFERGEVIGLIGPSGAGKSTLLQLLLRLRPPNSGAITVNGREISDFSIDDWCRLVAFVPQQPRLVNGTIEENIRFFRPWIDFPSVERAARLAHLHDEIMANPRGYQTLVGVRGFELSGGQRQRLCIARALVGSPQLFILDEPTSALDHASEALVRETLSALAPEATVFVVAHRFSTLEVCDRIMVLQHGMVQHFEAAAELERSDGFFRDAARLAGFR